MYFQVDGSNSRIAGTMHVFPAESPDMPEWLLRAYNWAEELVIESDPPTILPHRQLSDGTRLSDHLPPGVWRRLSELWLDRLGPLDSLKPWAAFLAAPQIFVPVAAGVETHFIERAKQGSKPIHTLESGADVAALLDALPTTLYAELLESIVSNPDTVRHGLLAIHAAWISRSIPNLLAFAESLPAFAVPALRATLFTARNRAWMPHFRVGTQAGRRTLFLIGALHLCGEDSVPELMKQEGHALSALE